MSHHKASFKHVNIVVKSYPIAQVAVTYYDSRFYCENSARHESAVPIDKIATIARVSQV